MALSVKYLRVMSRNAFVENVYPTAIEKRLMVWYIPFKLMNETDIDMRFFVSFNDKQTFERKSFA
jgi:hypothetical protein